MSTETTNARALAAMLRRKSVYRKYPGYQIGIIELDCEDRDAIAAELERPGGPGGKEVMAKYTIGSPVIELANAPDPETWRPSWVPKGETAATITRAMLELGYCMEDTPAPFEWADIDTAVMTELETDGPDYEPGTMGDKGFVWDVRLKDGRRFHVTGWHDYTGWGCQSGAAYVEVVRELSDGA